MKKLLGAIVLVAIVVLPIKVNAELSFSHNCTSIDYSTRTKTCEFYVTTTGSSALARFGLSLELKNLSIKSVTPNATWTHTNTVDGEVNGNITKHNLTFVSSTNVTGEKAKIATIVFDVREGTTSDDDCYIKYSPCTDESGNYSCGATVEITPTYTCKVVNGTYYDDKGNIVTEAEYTAACVKNPQTGNFLPYAIIAVGIALAVGVFTVSRRNNKLYKI